MTLILLYTLKAIKQWNEIQNFIKIGIYSTKKTNFKFLKSVDKVIKSNNRHGSILYTIMNESCHIYYCIIYTQNMPTVVVYYSTT